MFQKGGLKNLQTFFFVLLVASFALPILFYVHNQTSTPTDALKDSSYTRQAATRHPEPRHKIDGFGYQGSSNGQTVISIKADRFSLQKKKIGFFRFGLMNEARLDNAVVHIYGKREGPSRSAAGKSPLKASDRSQTDLQVPGDVTFKGIFKKETLPSFPVKRISAIVIEPVSLNLYQEESLITQINASSATIRLKRRSILFKENVHVVSGSRSLTTDQLIFLPEEGVIKTNRPFVLKTPNEQWDGARLSTDIFLKHVRSESKRSKTL